MIRWVCFGPLLVCGLVLSLQLLIPVHIRRRRREKMKVLALLGSPVCEGCEAEIAKYSGVETSDPEARIRYCYKCLVVVVEARRERREAIAELSREAAFWEDVGQVFSSFLPFVTDPVVRKQVRYVRKKRKKVRRKA